MNNFKNYIPLILALCFMNLVFISCNDDDDSSEAPLYFQPEISLSSESGEFGVGQIITIDAELVASGLLETLSVSTGNTNLSTQDYGATGRESFRFSIQVPATWLGTTQSIVFRLNDKQGQTISTTYSATISEIEPKYTIEDVDINGINFKQVTGTINFDETFQRSKT